MNKVIGALSVGIILPLATFAYAKTGYYDVSFKFQNETTQTVELLLKHGNKAAAAGSVQVDGQGVVGMLMVAPNQADTIKYKCYYDSPIFSPPTWSNTCKFDVWTYSKIPGKENNQLNAGGVIASDYFLNGGGGSYPYLISFIKGASGTGKNIGHFVSTKVPFEQPLTLTLLPSTS